MQSSLVLPANPGPCIAAARTRAPAIRLPFPGQGRERQRASGLHEALLGA